MDEMQHRSVQNLEKSIKNKGYDTLHNVIISAFTYI